MAGAVTLTEVDFQQIKNNLIDYLKSTKQFTDYDFSGSNLQVILNLIAYQAQLNAYSTNMIANESFLASASLRNNVVSNARMLGFVPVSARAANTLISFEYNLSATDYPSGFPQYLQINPGPCVSSGSGQENFTFNLIDPQIAAVSGAGLCRFQNVPIFEGAYLEIDFTVNEADFNQRFILDNFDIDTTTLRVEVQEDPNEDVNTFYRQANDLVQLDEDTPAYWVEEIDDQKYELTFGDGFFGKKLQNGARIFVSYVVTNGSLANGLRNNAQVNLVSRATTSSGAVITDRPTVTGFPTTEGGAEIESVGSVKFRAPKTYSAQSRCVVSDDYEALIKDIYPAIDDIYVYGGEELEIPQYGRVFIVVKPSASDALSSTAKNFIKKSLDDYRIASIDVVLQDPSIVSVEVVTTVYYDDKKTLKDNSAIVAAVSETLDAYSDSTSLSKFGGTIRYSRILGAIDDSDPSVTRNITELRMRRDFTCLLNTSASYELCFENRFAQEDGGGSIYSTGFQLNQDGINDGNTYYFEDDGVGNLYLFYFDINYNKVITNKEFGTVDYTKGEVMIGFTNPIKFASTVVDSNQVEVRAKPYYQDIEAKQTVYLDFDVAKSSINAAVDTREAS